AAAAGTGDAAVPDRGRRVRPALGDPAHRAVVRRGPVRAAPGAQDRAQRAVLAGVRRAAAGPLALRLARARCGALGAGGDGAAGAGVLRQQGGAGTGAAPRVGAALAPRSWWRRKRRSYMRLRKPTVTCSGWLRSASKPGTWPDWSQVSGLNPAAAMSSSIAGRSSPPCRDRSGESSTSNARA